MMNPVIGEPLSAASQVTSTIGPLIPVTGVDGFSGI
jgi:hypothetical protein